LGEKKKEGKTRQVFFFMKGGIWENDTKFLACRVKTNKRGEKGSTLTPTTENAEREFKTSKLISIISGRRGRHWTVFRRDGKIWGGRGDAKEIIFWLRRYRGVSYWEGARIRELRGKKKRRSLETGI